MCLPPCLCPLSRFESPLSGSMRLRLVEQTPIRSRYAVRAVSWRSEISLGGVAIAGEGEYVIRYSGPLAQGELALRLTVNGAGWGASGLTAGSASEPPMRLSGLVLETPVAVCSQHVFAVESEGRYLADLDGDGLVDFNDLLEFLNLYNAGDLRADFNLDGVVDFADLLEMVNEVNAF